MSRKLSLPPGLLLSFLISAALATGSLAQVTVIEAEGDFYFDAFHYSVNHSPCAWWGWSHEVGDGPVFHEETPDPPDDLCLDFNWVFHCDGNSLSYQGRWDQWEEDFRWGWLTLTSTLTCLIRVDAPVQLTAERSVDFAAPADPDVHEVVLTPMGGEADMLLGDDPSVTFAQRQLAPGDYRVTINVDGYQYRPPDTRYDALVTVFWEGPVGVEFGSWGTIKSLYR